MNRFPNAEHHVVDVSPRERSRSAKLVRVVKVQGKGMGVVAARDLPPLTFLGTYPGERLTAAEYARRRESGATDGKFAVDFWRPDVNGVVRTNYVVDPGDGHGQLKPRFQHAVAPLINEPGPRASPNVVWVWNLPRYALEHWTIAPVRAGEELTLCYGTAGGYQRSYETSCAGARQGEVEPELHVVTLPGAKPVPFSALGNAGVRGAVLALRRRGGVTGAWAAARRTAGTGSAASCTLGTRSGRTGRSTCTRRT